MWVLAVVKVKVWCVSKRREVSTQCLTESGEEGVEEGEVEGVRTGGARGR